MGASSLMRRHINAEAKDVALRYRMRTIIKLLIIVTLVAPLFWFSVCWTMCRLPSQVDAHIYEGEIHYKFVELDLSNRGFFESICSNSIVRLEENSIFYVSQSDHKKLWPEDPRVMDKNGYTYRAKLQASPLLFGGFGLAKVISIVRITKEPKISK